MRIDQIREQIKAMQLYVDLYSICYPSTLESKVFKYYAETNNVTTVTRMLNNEGHRTKGKKSERKLTPEDISIMLTEPKDEFQKIVTRIFEQSKNKVQNIWA